MLLELRQLSQSLQAANVTVGQQDDHLVGYSKAKPLFRVLLSDAAEVQRISLFEKDRIATLVKYEVSKGGSRESTPGFNVPPLLAASGSAEEQEAIDIEVKQFVKRMKRPPRDDSRDKQSATLDSIIGRCVPGWTEKTEAIGKCLTTAVDVFAAQLDRATGDDREAAAPLRELLRRTRLLTPDILRERMAAAARTGVIDSAGTDATEGLLQLLFSKDAAILLELADGDAVPANHPTVWQAVNRILLTGQHAAIPGAQPAGVSTSSIIDAFGDPYQETDEKMPERRLRRLGNVKLRSNSKSKPCQARYGLVEGQSFPVGADGRSALANSLAWLTADEREGRTFRDISNACGFDLPALLFAYPDPLPAIRPPAIAAVLSKTGQQGPVASDERFAAAAELVVRELDDLKGEIGSAKVTVFVLAKRDTARTKLLLSRQFSAERIAQAVRDWREAAANIPPVFVRLFGEDKKPRWVCCDDVPYPSDVARCMNRVWQRNGERVESIAVFDFGSALGLFLDDGHLPAELAAMGLQLACAQWVDLLLAMGQAATLGRVCSFSPNEQRLLPPILGLLLAKLGHRREVYMKALPYWLGRLLAVADRLHRNYCDLERDRQYPPQLIGNAAMPTCLENPQAGLARLAERLPLYQRVAGEDLRRETAEIISCIDPDNLPNRATDEHKAQILLGYLARPDLLRSEPPTTETQS